ncbi:uncharacterized protein BO80DRAFT_349697 [Aspergillus ibericus CBS 121593]|uniref:Uncharacterized protein n=1 Tax=Aspergillus ibericus CBS 121593 TaxID=1448316 RepID=A0A395H7K6_9EURO|nr:hypothetical protein BO80DRAFT_349697 [Aspergillus ibericus CBS 121593]RAL03640.1 hypothetical protein BO80DRAFT_349697 [Aspergillus ibericus CBS 121593]
MEKAFYFIDGIQPDRASKKQMRRHVMKGKNAGKRLHRASRTNRSTDSHQPQAFKAPGLSRKGSVVSCPVDRKFGDAIATGCLSTVDVNPRSLKIINQFFDLTSERLYPTTLGFSLSEAKLLWLRLLFTDEAAYHCNISLMQACNEIYLNNGSSTAKALYHLSQTFVQIQRRLASPDALSDSTMGLIVSLITQEQIRNQGAAADVHAKGLQRMVELRGGLGQLNRILVLRICKADILLSLQYGKPIMFFRDNMAAVWNKLASGGHLDHAPDMPCYNLSPYLHAILSDVMCVCYVFNSNSRHPIFDFLDFEEVYVSICYRLLRFISINAPTGQFDSQTACHLGLLMFTMTTFFQIDQTRIIDFKKLSLRFQNFLNGDLCELENDLSLWLLTLGGIWYSKDLNSDLIASKIRLLVQQPEIGSWGDFRDCLGRFPWIQALHDQPAHKLWNQVQQPQHTIPQFN